MVDTIVNCIQTASGILVQLVNGYLTGVTFLSLSLIIAVIYTFSLYARHGHKCYISTYTYSLYDIQLLQHIHACTFANANIRLLVSSFKYMTG